MNTYKRARLIFAKASASVAPSYCALCQQATEAGQALCVACETDLPWALSPCARCGVPLALGAEDTECRQCLESPPPWSILIAPCLYRWPTSELITRFKYQNDLQAGRALAILLAQHVIERYEEKDLPDLLVPVPLHWRRRWVRGFNQSEWLATQISRYWRNTQASDKWGETPSLTTKVCRRVQFTPNQQGLSKHQRQHNLKGAFDIRTNVRNKSIALLDDVVTTGSTVLEVSRMLALAGAANIDVWCLSRTEKH